MNKIDGTKLKILIACPTFALDPNPLKWLISLLTAVMDLHAIGAKVGFLFPYRSNICKAENQIIKHAIMNKYTHILRMDDDVWGIEPGDVLRLLAADREFISAVMFVRGFPYSRCAFRKVDPKMSLLECEIQGRDALEEVDGQGIQPVDLTAAPFTLYKVSMFEKMKYPWFDQYSKTAPDAQLCQKCADMGVQPYVDMDIHVNHCDVTPWNRLFLFNCEARKSLMTKKLDPTSKFYKHLVSLFGEDGMKDLYTLKGTGHENSADNMPE